MTSSCTLHPTSCKLPRTPHILDPTPFTMHCDPQSLNPEPYTLHHALQPPLPTPSTLRPETGMYGGRGSEPIEGEEAFVGDTLLHHPEEERDHRPSATCMVKGLGFWVAG